jgi:hypothetical protein
MLGARSSPACAGMCLVLVSVLCPQIAGAQANATNDSEALVTADRARFGVGARLRYVFMPESILEAFVEDAPSGVGRAGFGIELLRRKGNFDIVVAIEYEGIAPEDGLFLEKGDVPGQPGQNPDLVEFEGFALLGVDASFIWHQRIAPRVDLRYGAGIGIAAVLGDIFQTDTACVPGGGIESCMPDPSAPQQHDKAENVPPVVPLVNVLVGLRTEIQPRWYVNLEGGFRNLFYVGLGTAYLF